MDKKWGIFESENEVDVAPLDDLIDHSLCCGCCCRPFVEEQYGARAVVIHHSFDGREASEGPSAFNREVVN